VPVLAAAALCIPFPGVFSTWAGQDQLVWCQSTGLTCFQSITLASQALCFQRTRPRPTGHSRYIACRCLDTASNTHFVRAMHARRLAPKQVFDCVDLTTSNFAKLATASCMMFYDRYVCRGRPYGEGKTSGCMLRRC
jgi:hypothetical protein